MPMKGFEACERKDAYVGGSGSVLLLLHGLTATWHIWKPLLPALSARHQVIALTLPGHDGAADSSTAENGSIAALADTLVTRLRAAGVERAHVV
ncbi:MAG TPA: alpha/beta fold hydrolase, partial [Vineibacter sp.]|nr:alpha/beta fold hydrolase [Vineibacter sp.]